MLAGSMRKFSSLTLVAIILFFGACSKKDAEVSSVARAQAAKLAADAEMQNLLRDYAGAEKMLAQAVELDPEVINYWWGLGVNRALAGDMSGAKKAYKRELELCEKAAKKKKDDIEVQISALRPLVVLGRADDARKLLEKLGRDYPDSLRVKQIIANKPVDQMLENPKIQQAMVK